MKVSRVAGALGAEIQGFDVAGAIAKGEGAIIRELLNEHEVLFFRDQQLQPSDQRDVAALFGPLQTHPAYGTVDNIPEVMLLESTPENPSKIEVWHSDMDVPSTSTIGHCFEGSYHTGSRGRYVICQYDLGLRWFV